MEQLIAEVGRTQGTTADAQADKIRCAVRVIGLIEESADMPSSVPASLMVDLRIVAKASLRDDQLPDELAANRLASKCLGAIQVDKAKVPALIRRERHYLVDELGQRELSMAESRELDQLDDVRTVLRALRLVRPDVLDRDLAECADEWMALEPPLRGQ